MENPRSSKSQTQQKRKSNNKDNVQTPIKSSPKKKKSPSKTGNVALSPPKKQKSFLCETTRISGQQKLLFIKNAIQKKLSAEQIFIHYPYSQTQIYTFDSSRLIDEETHEIIGKIVQNSEGTHLVESVSKAVMPTYTHKHHPHQFQQGEEVFNGTAVSLFQDGKIFEGVYHDGKFCGFGYELHTNGNTYVGMFKEGIKSGEGTFYWFTNEEMYAGQWFGGLPHGYGTYVNKDIYEGNFSNGLKYGFGEELFSNGDRYIGQYINSIADGYGEYYWKDGSIYKGDFKHGVRHGYGIWKDQKEIYKGNYRLDKKEGFGVYKWIGKQIYKGEFREDFREGYGEFYSLVGQNQKLIYKGCWLKGQKYEQGKVEDAKIKELLTFLDESDRMDQELENGQKKQRKRVGHKNCIPHD